MVIGVLPDGVGRQDLEELLERGKSAGGTTHKLLGEWIYPNGAKPKTAAEKAQQAQQPGTSAKAKKRAAGGGGGGGASGSGQTSAPTRQTNHSATPGPAAKRVKSAFVKGPVTVDGVVYPHGCREDGWKRGT